VRSEKSARAAATVGAAAAADGIAADRIAARGGMSRLSLLLLLLPFVAFVAAGCGSKSAPRAVFDVRASDPSATNQDELLQEGADLLIERLALLGVPKEQIQVQRERTYASVEVPRELVTPASSRLATRTATLEVYDLEDDLAGSSKTAEGDVKPAPSLYSLLAPQQQQVEFKGADEWELFNTSTKDLVAGPKATPEALFRTRVAKARGIKPGKPPYVVFGVPRYTIAVSCGRAARSCPGASGPADETTWYLFKYQPPVPELTSGDIARVRTEIDPAQGSVVVIDLDRAGKGKFRDLTRTLYERGKRLQRPQHLAIVANGELRSWPQIDFTDPVLANGLADGPLSASFSSAKEAKKLALALEPLPVSFSRLH
jgi:preprotein translocase subunit SecD